MAASQRLIHIMRDGIEGTAEAIDLPVRIERVGVERVSKAEGPRQFLRDSPCVLCVQVKIQEVERLVRRRGERLCSRRRNSINVLRRVVYVTVGTVPSPKS